METKYGFKKFTLVEFANWLATKRVARTITNVQEHHTFRPDYANFNGTNHFALQLAMKNYHVNTNGWQDIGQHITIFPDATILTGRSFELSPACIFRRNTNSFCIENLGNFNKNKDSMTSGHKDAIIKTTALLLRKFSLNVNDSDLVYHHWFKLADGTRNNGGPSSTNKSCPGTNFFGGNKVDDFNSNFSKKVKKEYNKLSALFPETPLLLYATVNRYKITPRSKPSSKADKVKSIGKLQYGAALRVYEESENGWYKVSSSEDVWVCKRSTKPITKKELFDQS